MFSALGIFTPRSNLLSGSSRESFFSSTSWSSTEMTKVLVLLPMRNLSSSARRVLGSRLDEPKAWAKVPLPGTQMPTIAPGTGVLPPKAASSLFTAAEMADCVAGLDDGGGGGVSGGGSCVFYGGGGGWGGGGGGWRGGGGALSAKIFWAEPAEC